MYDFYEGLMLVPCFLALNFRNRQTYLTAAQFVSIQVWFGNAVFGETVGSNGRSNARDSCRTRHFMIVFEEFQCQVI